MLVSELFSIQLNSYVQIKSKTNKKKKRMKCGSIGKSGKLMVADC